MVGRAGRRGVTWWRGVTWPRLAGGALAGSVGLAALAPAVAGATAMSGPVSAVVVRAQPGQEAVVEGLAVSLGGRVGRRIGIINGFAATIGQAGRFRLAAEPSVLSVTGDSALRSSGDQYESAQGPTQSGYNPTTDLYSAANVESQMGSRWLWGSTTGSGVDVAVIDSGVTPVAGLNRPGQVISGPDLTEESQSGATSSLDTFGHGTFMAGLIAGHDSGTPVAQYNTSGYLGVAPNTRIVSVKVADARGMTDVSQVIAGIDWVVQHAHDQGMNIRVINLSYGTDSTQSYLVDPLAFAVEAAWRAGIVVVTSAGNNGAGSGRLTMPAADPQVIAVGAADLAGQSNVAVVTVPAFSSAGDGVRNPDVLAPGAHMQGLRVPGSYIDTTFGATGAISGRFFRGSGTSEAAAVLSGSVALLLQARPNLSPDQVKSLLVGHASLVPAVTPIRQGAGIMNIYVSAHNQPASGGQSFPAATGTGSLDGSRGSHRLALDGVTLAGEQDLMGQPFNAASHAKAEAAGSTWSGGVWNGSTWSGSTWSGSTWSGSTWSGSTWSGSTWSGSTWSGSTWSTGVWDGSTWSGSTWSGSTWSGSTWSGSTWSGSTWSDSTWT